MSSFHNCMRAAQMQGEIGRDQADALIERFEEYRREFAAAAAPDPAAAAREALARERAEMASQKLRRATLTLQAQGRIRSYLESHLDLKGQHDVMDAVLNLISHHGAGAGTVSIDGRARAIAGLAHSQINEMLGKFRRSRLTGKRFNQPGLDDVVREVLGEPTGKAEAKGMAQAVTDMIESLRQQFNAAGGHIGTLENYMPQHHNPAAVLNAGFDKWRAYIVPKLDINKMRDPLTGGTLSPARFEEVLKASFDNITTSGWANREPSMVAFGKGALGNQRADHRVLHFRSAEDWLTYNKDFGRGDPMRAISEHINTMSRDIAAMDVLGPNPNAMVEWMSQVVQHEAGKSIKGEPSLYRGGKDAVEIQDRLNYIPYRIRSLYDFVRGRQNVSGRWATGFGDVRNVLTSAQLGSASIPAFFTDPVFSMAARYMAGLPITKAIVQWTHSFRSGTREQAVRSGILLDDFVHIVGDEARYAGHLGGSEWSKWLADRTVNLNGLEALTQASRHVLALDFQAKTADVSGLTWRQLGEGERPNRYFRDTMESYGIGEREWDIMRATAQHKPTPESAGFIQPADIKNREVALRYLEMIYGETEKSTPTGTARSKSLVTGLAPRGTVTGELLESGLQYKTFGISVFANQLRAIQYEISRGGAARGAGYAMSLFTAVTLGGALAMQIKNVINGKDAQPMDPTTGQGLKFWMAAFQTGGGAGIMGDFLFSDHTRFGHDLATTLAGPTLGAVSDIGDKLIIGNLQELSQGKKTHFGREAVRTLGKYVPVVSTLPYTRAAYQRIFLDQLQYLADPEAHKYFREQAQRMKRETGQGYFWPPGQTSPQRGPDWSTARK